MEDGSVATGDSAGSTGASPASPTGTTASTGSAAPAIQATATTPITDSTGEPPKERWNDILANARTKERADAQAEWRQQYGWAESVDQNRLSQMAQWYDTYQGDPAAFLERAYGEALNHPIHGASVKSRVGKMLASMRQQQQAPEIQPDIPVYDDQGRVVNQTYSAQAMKQIVAQAVQAAIGREVDPLKQDFASRQQQTQQQQQQEHIQREGSRIKSRVMKYPEAQKHWVAIQNAAKSILSADKDIQVGEAISDAYMQVVYPTLTQGAQATVLSDLQKKANAQTVTGGVSGSARPKFKNFSEAHDYFDKHPEEAAAMAERR